MLKIFLALLFSFSLYASKTTVQYDMRAIWDVEVPYFEILLEFQGNQDGRTQIELPSTWAGQDELYRDITNLRCDSTIEDTEKPSIKTIHHRPNEQIKLAYQVQVRKKKETFYAPLIHDNYFYFLGHNLFITPLVYQGLPHIILKWSDFPSDWTFANSFGVGEKIQLIDQPLYLFKHAVFVGGDFKILKCGDEKSPVYIAIRDPWSFPYQSFIDLVDTITQSQRHFWNDFDFPHYLIVVLPSHKKNSIGGTGLTNAFSIFIEDTSKEKSEEWKRMAWLLSHEHFHTWNGIKMTSTPPDGHLYWFTEGFTEFYAATLAFRTGITTFSDYIDHINTIFYEYYISPVRNEKNEKIQNEFWMNPDVNKLPYQRGFILALLWDKKIRDTSRGEFSLDDFMRALFKTNQEEKKGLYRGQIEQVMSEFLPLETVQNDLDRFIIHGETLIPDFDYFGSKCSLKWMENVGFNLQKTKSAGYIREVKAGSVASLAGLKNGQKFINYIVKDGRVTVRVIDFDYVEKDITYPSPDNDFIPYYSIRIE